MDYEFSVPLDPAIVREHGCFTTLAPRRSITAHEEIADKASRQLLAWVFSDAPNTDYTRYSIGPLGHAVALTIPECLPDRLEPITHWVELGFIHDGKDHQFISRRCLTLTTTRK
jgi:hypothetical protein